MKESIYQYISKMAETYLRLPYEFQDISQAGARTPITFYGRQT